MLIYFFTIFIGSFCAKNIVVKTISNELTKKYVSGYILDEMIGKYDTDTILEFSRKVNSNKQIDSITNKFLDVVIFNLENDCYKNIHIDYELNIIMKDVLTDVSSTSQKYIELISKIRPLLTDGVLGYYESMPFNNKCNSIIKKAIDLTNDILKGRYVFSNGVEKLFIDSDRFIKINFTSSGQQEAVWIFNILLYQLINNKRTFIILEEPEAHLYPDAQKQIMELLSLFMNSDNSLLITTHSPYILGAINNLLYASQVYNKADSNKRVQVERIICKDFFIHSCNAYFVKDGTTEICIDTDDSLIINEVIDGASQDINNDYDALFDIIYEE